MTRAITLRLRYDGEHTKLLHNTAVEKRIAYLRKTLPRFYFNIPEISTRVRNDVIPVLGYTIAEGVSQALLDLPDAKIFEAVNRIIANEVSDHVGMLRTKLPASFGLSWVVASNYAENKVTVYVAHPNLERQGDDEHHTYEISWWGAA